MKQTIKLLIMLCIANVYSQKVKVKKEVLLIDKQKVCKFIETKRNQNYTVKDLNGNLVCTLAYLSEKIETLAGSEDIGFLKFNKPNSNKDYYSDYDITGLKFSFSGEKTLVRHLIKKNQFLSSKGLNLKNIEEFFSQPRPKSAKAAQKIKEYQEAYKYVTDFNLKIKGNKIYKEGEKDTLAGSYKIKFLKNMGFSRITIFDAKAFVTATYSGNTISLFDGQKIKYTTLSRDDNENAKKIIERIIIAGYTLGDMQRKKANIRIKNKKKSILKEKETSANIYNQSATIYTEDGLVKGEVTLEFKELENEKSNVSSLKNYGGVVTLKTIKENGKFKYTDYKAKNGVKICLENSKKCYQGIRTPGLTAAKFNLEVNTKGKLKLYKSKSFTYYILKKDNKEKGLIVNPSSLFKTDNSEKMFEKIVEYLENCPNFKSKLNIAKIDLKKEADLEKIIEVYNNCD